MKINSFNNITPVFCAEFSKDENTRNILRREATKLGADSLKVYATIKGMENLKDGTISLQKSSDGSIEVISDITGKSIKFNDWGFDYDNFWDNMSSVVNPRPQDKNRVAQHIALFGEKPDKTTDIDSNEYYDTFHKDIGTYEISKNMAEKESVVDMLRRRVDSKLNKIDELNKEIDSLYEEIKNKETEYILSLIG